MLPDDGETKRLAALTAAIAADASARDADGGFPRNAFAQLNDAGLLAAPPIGSGEALRLLRLLAAVGRGDLSVGRIYEGHVNALLLIQTYGDPKQRERYRGLAAGGAVFGVWNTDAPDDPLRLDPDGNLLGKKNFASGVDGLSHAIVTVTQNGARRMIVTPVAGRPVDRSWWRPLGMRASGSHVVDLNGVTVEPGWMLGGADDYVAQPWFSGGAIRFLAVQVGGMHAVFDAAVAHLRQTDRAKDPHQAHRLARLGVGLETGYLWLRKAAEAWDQAVVAKDAAGTHLMATANGARVAVEAAALALLEDAERGVGAAGMIAPHSLERLIRDMRTYLRQPNPDGAATAFGAAIADGRWIPNARHGAAG
ncbi:acyl-CoA dehydrogenase family protein [Hansschlegelia quercus]|uniref:Acyl-CoA dehydrogenase n=1 Tax=Hansschlegelia quercus TaxID=2528245 RepID=A0A4Q9GFK5_9HYPH|nr:acyl-CoA dehydrogenase family protein [Hansschlegelia quercus]TBN51747.1 acyl-CoA dehydrogenase [Hansschlegelia quercus]